MAATKTVPQLPQSHNSLIPRHGVVTLFGYGIQVRVDRGHLLVDDGIGADRRHARFPRVRHGLERLVVIGSDGMVSLAALRWLACQNAAFVLLERDGSVLATTGPVRPSDARLRRAQSLSGQSGAAIPIARELIQRKLLGQEQVARYKLLATKAADSIAEYRAQLAQAETPASIRLIESQAAGAYWATWRNLPINFPKKDESKIPQHWCTFGTRVSPLTGSPRLAVNPPNAILNYLYALLEAESRLAAAALGLDPGIGVLHVDTPARDSLACDLMEAVRPQIDGFLVDWVTREPLKREWFFEKPDWNCRLMAPLAARLSETSQTWARAVAPVAEWVARAFWSTKSRPSGESGPASRLTQSRRREAKGSMSLPTNHAPRPQHLCGICGASIEAGKIYCAVCAVTVSRENLIELAREGRVAALSPEAQIRRAATKRRHDVALSRWQPSSQPAWLSNEVYRKKIQPLLGSVTNTAIASVTAVSMPYAADIRAGRRRPHPRHWQALAELTGVSDLEQSLGKAGKH